MLLIDDALRFPISGLLWVFQEIRDAAEQDLQEQADSITLELQQLYASLEQGHITEEEFDRREMALLDRLDALEGDGDLVEEDEDDYSIE